MPFGKLQQLGGHRHGGVPIEVPQVAFGLARTVEQGAYLDNAYCPLRCQAAWLSDGDVVVVIPSDDLVFFGHLRFLALKSHVDNAGRRL
jgi:hypothetical protein